MSDLSRGFLSFGAIRLFMVATSSEACGFHFPLTRGLSDYSVLEGRQRGPDSVSHRKPALRRRRVGIIFWNFFERPVFRFSEELKL